MSISDVIQNSTIIGPAPQPETGFGLRMVLAQHANFPTNTRLYSGTIAEQLAALLVDGFTKRDAVYRAIEQTGGIDIASQKTIVAKRTPGTKKVSTITITAVDDFKYFIKGKVDANGIPVLLSEFTSGTGATVASIGAGLMAALDTSHPFSVVDSGAGVLTLTGEFYSDFDFDVSANLVVAVTTPYAASAQAIDAALDLAIAERPDAYRYEILSVDEADVDKILSWSKTKDKLVWMVNSSTKNLVTDATSALAKAKAGQHNVNCFVSDRYWEFPNVGIDSRQATYDLDEVNPTYNNVALGGYSYLKNDGVLLTAAEKAELVSKNAYYMNSYGQASRTSPFGSMSNDSGTSKRWTDHRVSRDYIDTRMKEALSSLVAAEAQAGPGLSAGPGDLAKVVGALTNVWRIARGEKKHVQGDITVDLSVEELTIAQVLTRILKVSWSGKIGHKVNAINDSGTLLLAL